VGQTAGGAQPGPEEHRTRQKRRDNEDGALPFADLDDVALLF
jgi:hypothetical protein